MGARRAREDRDAVREATVKATGHLAAPAVKAAKAVRTMASRGMVNPVVAKVRHHRTS